MTELALRSHAFVRPPTLDTMSTTGLRIALVGTVLLVIAGVAGVLQAAVFAPFVMLMLLVPSTQRPGGGRLLPRLDREGRARAKTERQRRRRLRPTGPLILGKYDELRQRVDGIARSSRPIADKLELEDLLEHYVRIGVSYHQYLSALPLWSAPDPVWLCDGAPPPARALRIQIAARREAHRTACWRRVDELVNELDAIDELVALIEQRLSCPEPGPELDGEIPWRLSVLDDIDAALREITGEARHSSRAAPG